MTSTVYVVERLTDYERSEEVAAYHDEGVAERHAERENRRQYEANLADLRATTAHWETYAAENPPSELQQAIFEIKEVADLAKTPGPRRAARQLLETLPKSLTNLHDVRISVEQMRASVDKASASFEDWAREHGEYRVYGLIVSDSDPNA